MKKLLILTFFTIMTYFLLVATYGVFESKVLNGTQIKLAAWNVEVNNSIVTNEDKTFTIEDIICSNSENVLNGKIAPGVDGYFDIVVDPKTTDVSVRYDITYDVEYLKNINKAFIITKVENLEENEIILTDKYTYTGIIFLGSKANTIRTHIKWEDIEDNGYNDYITGTTSTLFELPVNIEITQYMGEEIIEYNEE